MAPKKKTITKTELSFFKVFLYVFLVGFVMMIFIGYSVLSGDQYTDRDSSMPEFKDPHSDDTSAVKEKITHPIVLWWTGFTAEPGRYRKCGEYQCFFTIDRHYYHHPKTKAFAFYGTDFNSKDVPMPRKPDHDWALLHEESPKNNYLFSYLEALELFNHTSTFSRYSDLPLLTQFLDSIPWLESKKYLVPTREKNQLLGELAPILYVQSDCGTPANRDEYVKMLMQEIKVDSYGVCLQNKHLPEQ